MNGCRWLIAILVGVRLWAADATYYIDYADGDDARPGTSAATAWKHAPGSAKATGAAQAAILRPGDVVLFKGGVTYREAIEIPASGEAGRPITYKGDGWGEAKAIVDGSAAIGTPWTPCTAAEQVRGNKEFRNISYTDAPAGFHFLIGTYEDDAFIYPAQDPQPTDQFNSNRTDQMRVLPCKDPAVGQTVDSIRDARNFTQDDPAYYDGAYVMIWHQPNVTRTYRITGFDPATHTIRHEKIGGAGIYTNRDVYYAIMNHPAGLSGPGQYCHDEKTGRLYVWPRQASGSFSVTQGGSGITAKLRRHLRIEGFIVRKFVFGINVSGSDVVIRGNTVHDLKSNGKYAIFAGGADMLVVDNRITDCHQAVGILSGGRNVVIKGNVVRRASRQGIWFMDVDHGQIIGNTLDDISGTHSNGISLYQGNKDILVAGNKVWRTGSAMTYHGNGDKSPKAEGVFLYNNIFDGAVNCWGKQQWDVVILNNTFLGPANVGFGTKGKQVFVNNIVHVGGGGDVRHHNLYTALGWNQTSTSKWSLGEGEIDWSKKGREEVFAAMAERDYRPKEGSPAIAAGANGLPYLPLALFPDYDFAKDIDDNARPKDGAWDIGACNRRPELAPGKPAGGK